MKNVKGKPLDEIDPYIQERKNIYGKLVETLLISSYSYLNDFSKFMIGLNTTLLSGYIALFKVMKIEINHIVIISFILQIITILLFILAIYPRQTKSNQDKSPLIFTPGKILYIYNSSISQKLIWVKLGALFFLLYLISIVFTALNNGGMLNV